MYRAWIDPPRLARWWGPSGFTNEFEVCELRPGGEWRYVMIAPHGGRYQNECAFVELVPGQRVVIEHRSPPVFQLIASFEAEGAGTRVTWRQVFPTAEDCERVRSFAAPANEQNLERLAAEVSSGR